MRNREALVRQTVTAPMVRWLQARPEKERRFFKQYGPYTSGVILAQILGWSGGQIEMARRYWNARPRRNATRVSFPVAFEAFQRRPPKLDEYPPPRWFPGRQTYEWTAPQDELLMAQYGLVSKEDLASQLTRLLVKLTGDSEARRSPNTIITRAGQLGLDGRYNHGTKGLLAKQAAEESGISIHVIIDAVAKGELPALRWVSLCQWLG